MSQCKKCGAKAYISFTASECSNPKCEDYNPKTFPPEKTSEKNELAESFEDNGPQYIWMSHHYDFGD